MARSSARGGGGKTSRPQSAANTIIQAVGTATGSGTATGISGQTNLTGKKPRQTSRSRVAANFPTREVTYYQLTGSDLAHLGIAQPISSICAGIAVWFLNKWLELDRLSNQLPSSQNPNLDQALQSFSLVAGLIFLGLSAWAWTYHHNEIHRIKSEHGESPEPWFTRLPVLGYVIRLFKSKPSHAKN